MPQTPPLKGGVLRNFSGGLNIRDSASELAQNEVADAWNVTFDERGGVTSRRGYAKDNSTPFSGGMTKNKFWSSILGANVTQAGPSLFLGTTNTVRKTFTTSELVTFTETNSLVVACHPTDGLFTSADGITWTAVADPDAPKGTCVFLWQGKVYVGGPNGKLSWSVAGDPTSYVATDFNKVWEKDQTAIVALHVGSGQDAIGKPGLIVFKQESFYRVNDASTGAYVTLDASVGAAGAIAVIGVGSKVCFIGKRGIYWWREGMQEATNASDRFLPLWDSNMVDFSQLALWCAGRKQNRAFFSLTRKSSTANDLAFEFHAEQSWLAPRSDAMSCYTTSTGTTEVLYGGSPTVTGQSYTLDTTGADDGTAIAWRLQTRWIEPNSGFQNSLWQVRIHGRGAGTITFRKDYASSGGDAQPFDLTSTGITYDSGLFYDTGLFYSEPTFQETETFYSLGLARQFSVLLSGSSSTTYSATQVLGAGTNPAVGYFALYGLEWLYVPLGLS